MIRLTGINSGFDTEAMIQELTKTRQQKVDKVKNEQTKLTWKQDAWKTLNSKISKLYTTLDNLKFSTTYSTKKTTVSEPNVANISTDSSAPYGSYTLNISQTASYANMTGNKINGNITSSSKLSDMGINDSGSFEVKKGNETVVINYDKNDTLSDLKEKFTDLGLQANFDDKNKRFFLSSKESGADYNFSFSNDTSNALEKIGLTNAVYNEGKNLKLALNNVDYESNSNTITINDLTIQAIAVTKGDATISTVQDNSGIYSKIKDFIKQYNELVKEIDKMYNAESSKDYKMLSDDEKDSMSEKQVEEWENKIKDSLLRNDDTLGGIYDIFKQNMTKTIEMSDGSKLSLSDFGIETLSYFVAPKNERYVLHIDGDADDDSNSSKANKLENFIQRDPEKLSEFFSKLAKDIYDKLSAKSSSVANTRSYGKFYQDKKLQSDIASYKTKIVEEEKKMNAFMDKYYKQFARMETAFSKINSQSSYLTSLFG